MTQRSSLSFLKYLSAKKECDFVFIWMIGFLPYYCIFIVLNFRCYKSKLFDKKHKLKNLQIMKNYDKLKILWSWILRILETISLDDLLLLLINVSLKSFIELILYFLFNLSFVCFFFITLIFLVFSQFFPTKILEKPRILILAHKNVNIWIMNSCKIEFNNV